MSNIQWIDIRWLCSMSAVALTFVVYIPYIWAILIGRTRPHIFSWMIWSVTTLFIFVAQINNQGGMGAYAIGLSGLISLIIAGLGCIKGSHRALQRIDWLILVLCVLVIIWWRLTFNPVVSVLLFTVVSVIGYLPTALKAWVHPFEEEVPFYVIMAIRYGLSVVALEHYALVTLLFPMTMFITSTTMSGYVHYRKAMLKYPVPPPLWFAQTPPIDTSPLWPVNGVSNPIPDTANPLMLGAPASHPPISHDLEHTHSSHPS